MTNLGYRPELKRALGLPALLAYGLVFMSPTAPVALFGIVFNASHGMVPLIYAIGLMAMILTALSYREMSREFPVAGSVYTYATQSLGHTVGFLGGWAMLLDYFLIPTISYVASAIAVHAALPMISREACVIVMLLGATTINALGVETTARASFVVLFLQLLIIALFIALGLLALSHHVAGAHLSLQPFYNRNEITPGLVFGSLSFAVLSFLGFDAITTLSEEAKDGAVAIGRATMLSLYICATLFMVQTWLAALFLLGTTKLPSGEATQAAFYDIANLLGGNAFKLLLAVPGMFIAGLAGAVTAQAATARILYGMARDGKLPRLFAKVDSRRGVPLRSMLIVAGLTLVLGLLLVNRLELLSSMVSFGALLGFLLLHLSVVAHFIGLRGSRRFVLHLVVPVLGVLVISDVLWSIQRSAKIAGAVWLCAGVAVLVSLRLRKWITAGGSPASGRNGTQDLAK